MSQSVMVLEYNELVPDLLDRFIAEGHLPNFKRLRDESIVAVTDAEEEAPLLEPWIQWVTVHSGVSFAEHKCFDLNSGAQFKGPRIWDLVSQAGGSVWICGSMNAGVANGSINGHILPDAWATEFQALPLGFFEPYTNLVRRYVQEHSATRTNVGLRDILQFVRFMIQNGLSATTVWSTVRQLASEKLDHTQWRRATILNRLQWDLFKSIYRSKQPTFATFFLNSTAHFQHFHWREMEPNRFSVKPRDEDVRVYGEAILFGYQQMDKLVGEALDLAGPETTVVMCTALSQQPMLTFEDEGGRQIFRHHDHKTLLDFAGVSNFLEYSPIMSQQFILNFANSNAAEEAADRISALRMETGEQLMLGRVDGTKVLCGCLIDSPPPQEALFSGSASNDTLQFWDCFYPLEALRSGMHHPDGALWIRTPSRRHAKMARKVSLREIAPTLLSCAGIDTDQTFAFPAIKEVCHSLEPELADC
jgi:hypothetical protein